MKNILKELSIAMEEKFATDILILDIRDVSSLGDHFVIATVKNENQLRALSESVTEVLEKQEILLKHAERSPSWVLLDFGVIIVHLFDQSSRDFYNIERLWADAKEEVFE